MHLNRTRFLICAALLLSQPACAEIGHSQAAGEEPVGTTVCDLVARPQDFNGRVVRIRAQYRTDGMHLRVLTDSRCRGGVVPFGHFWDSEVSGAFFAALDKYGCVGTSGDEAIATWTGTYDWEPENTPATAKYPRGLDVQKIEKVEIKPGRGCWGKAR